MGFAKGKGPRRCPVCRNWYPVSQTVEIDGRYYCSYDAALVRRRRADERRDRSRKRSRVARSGGKDYAG